MVSQTSTLIVPEISSQLDLTLIAPDTQQNNDYLLHQPRDNTRKVVADPWSNCMEGLNTLSHPFHRLDGGAARAETDLLENT